MGLVDQPIDSVIKFLIFKLCHFHEFKLNERIINHFFEYIFG